MKGFGPFVRDPRDGLELLRLQVGERVARFFDTRWLPGIYLHSHVRITRLLSKQGVPPGSVAWNPRHDYSSGKSECAR